MKEEHYLVCSGDGKYLFHFIPEPVTRGTPAAEKLANKLHEWLVKHGLSEDLIAIVGDSTIINTGWEGGAIHYLEEKL